MCDKIKKYLLIPEADNIEDANEIADNMDGGDFKEYDVGWVIEEEKTYECTKEIESTDKMLKTLKIPHRTDE